MPTVSIYVSNEDYDKFRAIEKKSEFIHHALNQETAPQKKIARAAVQPKEEGVIPMTTAQPIIKTKDDAVEAVKQLFPDAKVITPLYRDKKNKKL